MRLLRLVNDILSLIRLEEGRASLAKKQIDMIHFLRHTTASMKHLAALKGISLDLKELDSDLIVNADPDALEKIIGNVIANAIKFTPPDGRIDVSAAREEDMVTIRSATRASAFLPNSCRIFSIASTRSTALRRAGIKAWDWALRWYEN